MVQESNPLFFFLPGWRIGILKGLDPFGHKEKDVGMNESSSLTMFKRCRLRRSKNETFIPVYRIEDEKSIHGF